MRRNTDSRNGYGWLIAGLLTLSLSVLSLPGTAAAHSTKDAASGASTGQSFTAWLKGVRAEARAKGIRQDILDQALKGIAPIPRIIELDRRQTEFTVTFQDYINRIAAPQSRIEMGRRLLAENRDVLEAVGRKYGVQPRFIVALWGIESNFGQNTGGFYVVEALATLAYDGRRSSYFRKELMNALKILNEGHIQVSAMKGSWAGAMGQSQFMPSSFLSRAQDFDGDGRRDIWTTRADVFASAANYLSKAGWQDDITWGRAARLPPGFNKALVGLKVKRTLPQWQKLGVRRSDGGNLPGRDISASIVIPDRSGGQAFLVYKNFRTIKRWNNSTFFALAVGHLADGIGQK